MDEDSDRNEDENIDEDYYSDKNEDSDEDGENNKNEDENEDELDYTTMTIITLFLYPLRWDFLRRAKRKKKFSSSNCVALRWNMAFRYRDRILYLF